MAYSYITYEGDGFETNFVIPFEYLLPEHVYVYVDGEAVTAQVNGSTVTTDEAPGAGTVVLVQRQTPISGMLTEFAAGPISKNDLNAASLQLLFGAQEQADAVGNLDSGTPSSNILFGTAGARPAAGTANRLYVATDTKQISYDNGSAWFNIGPEYTGDVTKAAASNTLSLADDTVSTAKLINACVTLAKMANLDADKIIGSIAGGTPEAIACTATGRTLIACANAAAVRTAIGVAADSAQSISVHRNGVAQASVPSTTYTKIEHNVEAYDASGVYDNATNYRFTPTVAGKYLVTASVKLTNLDSGKYMNSAIFKNGVLTYKSRAYSGDSTDDNIVQVVALVSMNGTTDYLEHFIYHSHGSDRSIDGDTDSTFFQAVRVSA